MGLAIRQFDDIVPPFLGELGKLKQCPRCPSRGRDAWHSITDFGICRARKDGLNLYCKQCIREKINAGRQSLRAWRAEQKRLRAARREQEPAAASAPRPLYSDEIRRRLTRHAARSLRSGSPSERVLEAIRHNAHTQKEICSLTKLPKDEVCDALATLLLWTKEIRTQTVRSQRMYFINEDKPAQQKQQPQRRKSLNHSFSSIGILMPGAKPANQRRKTA